MRHNAQYQNDAHDLSFKIIGYTLAYIQNIFSQFFNMMLLYIHFLIFYRAEQQRNQALLNAEKLKEAFSDYKAKIATKLHQVNFILSVLFR